MHGNHWSLILFTLLAQTAAGTMIIRAILRYFFADSGETPSIQPAFRISLIISSTAMIMAALVSFFHLGSPLHAIYVLNNLAASWLSREILSVILFTGSLCLLTLLHIIDFRRKKLMLALEITTIILGLVLVFTMSRIYMLATVPVWNHIFTPLAFFGSTFLLGTAVWTLMMAYERELAKNTAQVIGYFCVAFGAIQLSLSMFHFLHLTELGIYPSGNWMIGIRLLSLLAGTVMATQVNAKTSRRRLVLIFLLFVFAELLGRYLFYAGYARIGI